MKEVKNADGIRVNDLDGCKFITVLGENRLDSKMTVELSKEWEFVVKKKKKKGTRGYNLLKRRDKTTDVKMA